MPAGFFLARRGLSPLLAVGVGLLISGCIEVIQLQVPGRSSTLRDVLTNGLGAGAGALAFVALSSLLMQRSRALAGAALAFPLVVVAATAVASVPIGTDGTYYAQWVPRRPYYARWDGAVLSAEIAGLRTPSWRMAHSDSAKRLLRDGGPVSLLLRAGTPTSRLTAYYAIMDDSRREVLMIGADGLDLVVRRWRAATLLRLDRPDDRFIGFLSEWTPGDTLALEMRVAGDGKVCVASARRADCAPRPAIGSAWGYVFWKGALSQSMRRTLDGSTIALALFPLGLALAGSASKSAGMRFALVAIPMAVLGRLGGLSWPGAAELAGALLAFVFARILHAVSTSGTDK